jgi:hypothetical protein
VDHGARAGPPGERRGCVRAAVGLSRGAIQKAKAAGRLVLHEDGSIDATASDRLRAEATDPSKTRKAPAPKLKPVPEAAVSAVGDTLKEQGLAAPATGGGTTFLQAKTAHEVLKAQERRIRLAKLKGELVDRDRATALVFRLAREERDAWVNWPARVAVPAAGWVVQDHPEITPPSNFHQLRDTTTAAAGFSLSFRGLCGRG